MRRKVAAIELTETQSVYLTSLKKAKKSSKDLSKRAKIILLSSAGYKYKDIIEQVGLSEKPVAKWCRRWAGESANLLKLEESSDVSSADYRIAMRDTLADEARSGCPAKVKAEQLCKVISLACQPPSDKDCDKSSHWTVRGLAREIMHQGIISDISKTWVGTFLKSGEFKATQG